MVVPATNKGLGVDCRIATDVPAEVIGDAGRLRQVIINLVGNALKFTQQGEIFIDCWTEDEAEECLTLHCTVKDTGIGIADDKRDRIFESFSQADASTTRRFGGTGLGLAISAQLVNLMGGQIWVESEVGKGSTFHFTVRVGKTKSERFVPPSGVIPVNASVLLVNPGLVSRDIHGEMLTHLNWNVTRAEDGVAAERCVRQASATGQPLRAVVIVGMVGAEEEIWRHVEQIANAAKPAEIPIVLVLPASQHDDTARLAKWRIARCVPKPAKETELHQALLEVVELEGSSSGSTGRSESAGDVEPLRILLAEDCLVNQEVAIGFLELRGHVIEVANNGREAVELMRERQFDLVLMDVEMPEMDGLQATQLIRQAEAATGRHTPIVAMTAHAVRGFERTCLEGGMDDYISKPIDARKLYQIVESAVCAVGSDQRSCLAENKRYD